MNTIPSRFRTLDGQQFVRIGKLDPIVHDMAEAGLDRIIAEHKDVLADLLLQAHILEHDSELKLLGMWNEGGQILNIDLLFAEVSTKGEFRRFVVVEDKLRKNAEQRREVLAQIIEYAKELQGTGRGALLDHLKQREPTWTRENEQEIDTTLNEGNLLLVLAGDSFDPRLVELVKHYQSRIDPTDLRQICMVSIGLFRSETGAVAVIPNLVGAVTCGHRDITIKVKVTTAQDEELHARVSQVVEADDSKIKTRTHVVWTEQSFFAELERAKGAQATAAARRIVEWANAEKLAVMYGGGPKEGYLRLPFRPSQIADYLSVDTKGRIWISPTNLKLVPPYTEEAARKELMKRLIAASGMDIPLERASTWTTLPLIELAASDRMPAVLRLAAEVYAECRAALHD